MMELRFQPVVSWPVVVAIATVLIALLWVRPRHVRLGFGKWAALMRAHSWTYFFPAPDFGSAC